jgi:predicted DsbA family dithiol-disulfide isomerase
MNEAMVTIDVVSDVMCPWCYIGKRRLEKAAAAQPEIALDVQWRPFQLDATIPPEGMDRRIYLERKFGGADAAERVYAPVRAAGEAEAIPFAFDRIRRAPNTINAHRLIRWAGQAGLQEEMVERLFRLYFLDGGDLTDAGVLADAAAEAGMERALVERLLAGEADIAEVREEIKAAQRMGITGVPTFIIAGRYAVVGAQPAEVLADAIAKARVEVPVAQ